MTVRCTPIPVARATAPTQIGRATAKTQAATSPWPSEAKSAGDSAQDRAAKERKGRRSVRTPLAHQAASHARGIAPTSSKVSKTGPGTPMATAP